MQKWEYTYLEKTSGWGRDMMEYGRKGWECYAVTINSKSIETFYFKRPL